MRISKKFAFLLVIIAGIAFYLAVFSFNSHTRNGQFSPDSMNYVDVAKNIATGKGIAQSTLGFNQAYLFDGNSKIPAPFTSQAPLYPLLIAQLGRIGFSFKDAALLIPAAAYGAILLLAFLLSRNLYGKRTALLSLAFLLFYYPLTLISRSAWSESVAAVFLLLSFYLLVRSCQFAGIRAIVTSALFSGLSAGLVFSTRYALFPLIFIGILFLARELRDSRLRLAALFSYITGALLPIVLVLVHNLFSAGYLMPPILPSNRSWPENAVDAIAATFGNYCGKEGWEIQAEIAVALIAVSVIVLTVQRRTRELAIVFVRQRHYLLTLWFLVFSVFMVYQRTVQHFDRLETRLLFPAGIVLILLIAALLVKAVDPWVKSSAVFQVILVLAILVASVQQVQITKDEPVMNVSAQLAKSDRFNWVADHTTNSDLIVGDDTIDITFFYGRTASVSFSDYPFTVHLTYENLKGFTDNNCNSYQHIYIVLRNYHSWPLDRQLYLFGQFITDVRESRLDAYPGIVLVIHLRDSDVFEVACKAEI